jgi:hypothetical protein
VFFGTGFSAAAALRAVIGSAFAAYLGWRAKTTKQGKRFNPFSLCYFRVF